MKASGHLYNDNYRLIYCLKKRTLIHIYECKNKTYTWKKVGDCIKCNKINEKMKGR